MLFYHNSSPKGFTLIQMLIDLAILAVLLTFLILLIDPIAQLKKARDATRKHDTIQIKNALDTYYNDHNCYPSTIPYGQEWREFDTVYMVKVPQDPDCGSNPAYCYLYQVDLNDTCPQWNVIYTKQSKPVDKIGCSLLASASPCVPTNYDTTWACSVSGNVNCSYISSNPVLLPLISPSPTPGGATITSSFEPTATLTPTTPPSSPAPTTALTITPSPTIACASKNYACTGGPPARCNNVAAGSGTFCASNCDGVCN